MTGQKTQATSIKTTRLNADVVMVTTSVHNSLRARIVQLVVWLPLALLMVWLGFAMLTAQPLLPSAFGATGSAGDVDVTGDVLNTVYVDTTGCSAPASLALGDIVPGDPFQLTASSCVVVFGATAIAGADLSVLEDPTAPVTPTDAMKCLDASCGAPGATADVLDDYQGASYPGANTSAFGIVLDAATTGASGVWSVAPNVHRVAAADLACQTSTDADGTCSFHFGASAHPTSDRPGAYQAQVQFAVLPR